MALTGNFSVLCYNVAGLPAFLSSGTPSTCSVEMGKRIAKWDIVNVQEDFNYHAELYSKNKHEYRTETSGGVPFGSGLNSLSTFPFTNTTAIERTTWTECSNFEGMDCLTPKGFTLVEVEVAEGVTLDVYNLHADAGVSDADQSARASNLKQLSDYITTHSANRAVLVMGDTNTRYTRARDTIRDLVHAHNFTDAWVATVRKGQPPKQGAAALMCDNKNVSDTCEVVDKILFRGNHLITLHLDKWHNENAAFLGHDGSPLSDHAPISARFSYTLHRDVTLTRAFGAAIGTRFTDVAHATAAHNVTSITVRSSSCVQALKLHLAHPVKTTLSHGGHGARTKTLTLKVGEYVKSMEMDWQLTHASNCITYVKFTTNQKRTIEGGARTREGTTVHAPKGFQLSGFHGRASTSIHALGAIFTRLDGAKPTKHSKS
ncbi:hypothetical protein PsorP6_014169 [Peronosclerospora sorghi]|uniref:Uncharacterized protein n=1 Tax=Peronosclerospora sorghi TaxID=230839 RepID=A0ACC0VJC0_9STRA|nr:hypothetical protein PsorP6_014169 [Peronosclerospora sorghi]